MGTGRRKPGEATLTWQQPCILSSSWQPPCRKENPVLMARCSDPLRKTWAYKFYDESLDLKIFAVKFFKSTCVQANIPEPIKAWPPVDQVWPGGRGFATAASDTVFAVGREWGEKAPKRTTKGLFWLILGVGQGDGGQHKKSLGSSSWWIISSQSISGRAVIRDPNNLWFTSWSV